LSNEDLLRPTLSEYRQPPAIYSSTGFFMSAFFGGPLGVAIYGACNSRRLGRLAVDLPVILALVVGVYFLAYVFVRGGQIASLAEIMAGSPEWTTELTLRAFALACYGAIYLRHRRFFRAARVSGVKPLTSWVPGIAAVVLGYLANHAFIQAFVEHHRVWTLETL
jgi:hypothetical protein